MNHLNLRLPSSARSSLRAQLKAAAFPVVNPDRSQRLGPESRSSPRGGVITSRGRTVWRRRMSRNARSSASLARRYRFIYKFIGKGARPASGTAPMATLFG